MTQVGVVCSERVNHCLRPPLYIYIWVEVRENFVTYPPF